MTQSIQDIYAMPILYEVKVDTGETYDVDNGWGGTRPVTKYGTLDHKGRSTWKTKRIAEKHAREYKATHLRDAWVQEV